MPNEQVHDPKTNNSSTPIDMAFKPQLNSENPHILRQRRHRMTTQLLQSNELEETGCRGARQLSVQPLNSTACATTNYGAIPRDPRSL